MMNCSASQNTLILWSPSSYYNKHIQVNNTSFTLLTVAIVNDITIHVTLSHNLLQNTKDTWLSHSIQFCYIILC